MTMAAPLASSRLRFLVTLLFLLSSPYLALSHDPSTIKHDEHEQNPLPWLSANETVAHSVERAPRSKKVIDETFSVSSYNLINQVVDDNYEENDSRQNAHDLSSHEGTWLSDIDGHGIQADDDWYQIEVMPGRERVLVDCQFTHADGDIDIELRDSLGNWVDDSTGIWDDEFIDHIVDSGGTYYIKVFLENRGNTYDLWWDNAVPTPTPTPTPKPTVSISAHDSTALESGNDVGVFRFSRNGAMISDLDVYFSITGSATINDDYNAVVSPVRILSGQSYRDLTITPNDDLEVEGDETVILSLAEDITYDIGSPDIATVTIEDDDESQLKVLIHHFYRAALDRDPESQEAIEYWEWFFNQFREFNIDVRYVVREMGRLFLLSEEYQGRNPGQQLNTWFIDDCYYMYLQRHALISEVNNILSSKINRKQLVSITAKSLEFNELMERMFPGQEGILTRNFAAQFYYGGLDRMINQADLEYLENWMISHSNKRQASIDAAKEIFSFPEFFSVKPNSDVQVERLYRCFLDRFPSDDENTYWVNVLDSGRQTINQTIEEFGNSMEFSIVLEKYFPGWESGWTAVEGSYWIFYE